MSSLQPETDGDDNLAFTFLFGMNVITEFVEGHTPVDVLRELVQNEYDAGGSSLEVAFGQDALVVKGNGKPIEDDGWKRLKLILGTGRVVGRTERVEPKSNGIGSKNFGLRSLFLFGDRIEVASGGLRTILDLNQGALLHPVPDIESSDQPGVRIRVPYRLGPDSDLRVFDEEYEAASLRAIADELAPTVIKLAQPGSTKNLRSVRVTSHRLNQELRWHQSVRRDRTDKRTLWRAIRLEQKGDVLPDRAATVTEIEYQRTVHPPVAFSQVNVPEYFKVPGGRVRLGISFRTRPRSRLGHRIDLGATGFFYYPIGVTRSRTGFPFNISAPFHLNGDRSELIESPWNDWLIRETAQIAVRLLPDRLFPTFGGESFRAFDIQAAGAATMTLLVEEIGKLLREETCWPSRTRGGRKPVFRKVGDLVFPFSPALADCAGVLPDEELLHADLAALPEVRSLAAHLGGKAFTIGSLIRLRCAGASESDLQTKLDAGTEASYWYPDFPAPLEELSIQRRFAAALDAARGSLRPDHRADLKHAPTTLTAAGTLSSPDAPLRLVPDALAAVIPGSQALHPGLADYRVLARLCKPFSSSDWVIETADRITASTAPEEVRAALGSYLRDSPSLSSKAWAAVRRAPVLQDDRGRWVEPTRMVSRQARGVGLLRPALYLPTPADQRNPSLRALHFRPKVQGTELVELARLAESGTVPPTAVEAAIRGMPQLLTRNVLSELKGIRFLETAAGSVLAPTEAYVRSEQLAAVIGEDAPYAVGWPEKLLLKLGCRTDARADDIVAFLKKLKESGGGPAKRKLSYETLVSALRREKRPTTEFSDQKILYTGTAWEAPDDCLIGEENRRVFVSGVSVLPANWRDVGTALGARTSPQDSHWRHLLIAVSEDFTGQPVSRRVAGALHAAYRTLDHVPLGLPSETRCLMDGEGLLHSLQAASLGRYLINDDPLLARAAADAALPIAFAVQIDVRGRQFLIRAGARLLSGEATLVNIVHGDTMTRGKEATIAAVLEKLRDPIFASALAALAGKLTDHPDSPTTIQLAARLANIEHIDLVDGLSRRYRLAGADLTIPTDYAVQADRITVNNNVSSLDLWRAAADAIAVIASPGPEGEQILADPAYFLLRCKSHRGLQRELERRKSPGHLCVNSIRTARTRSTTQTRPRSSPTRSATPSRPPSPSMSNRRGCQVRENVDRESRNSLRSGCDLDLSPT